MSREIGFRVWGKENEEYMNGYEVLLRYDGSVISRYALVTFDTDMPVNGIIEWDTGLKDKNGKKIYVGDIVSCGDRYPTNSINYNDGRFWLGDSVTDLFEANIRYDIEVIGNIHENPELLEAKNE